MVIYYYVYNDFSKLGCIKADLEPFIVDYLSEPINNDKNEVVIVSFPID